MAQDLRKLFEEQRKTKKFRMAQNHEERFLGKLDEALPKKKKRSFSLWKIAASVLVLIGLGWFTYQQLNSTTEPINTTVVDKGEVEKKQGGISLGDLSPDLKKVENYYIVNINYELSRLQISEDNKAMVDGFMDRLQELNGEYKRLNAELNQIGPNDQTINALIKNLQLRLELLHKLKEKLNELKSSKNEHDANTI